MELRDVKALVNHLGDGPDLGPELLLDPVQGEPVVVGDQVDSDTKMSEATRATDTMQVSLGHLGEVKVDNHVHRLNVNSAREQIWQGKNKNI